MKTIWPALVLGGKNLFPTVPMELPSGGSTVGKITNHTAGVKYF
jgi:hypothetical protein